MANLKKIGNIKKRHDETEFEWEITNFFTIAENEENFTCPFSFVDTSWHFRIYPRSARKPGFVNMLLVQVGDLECSVEYNFGLKKVDGSVSAEHLSKGILTVNSENFTENEMLHRYTDFLFFKLSEVRKRKSEFSFSDTLTVTCTLKRLNTHTHQAKMLKAEILMPPKLQKFMSK